MFKRLGLFVDAKLKRLIERDSGWRGSASIGVALCLPSIIASNGLNRSRYDGPGELRDFFVSTLREEKVFTWAFERAVRIETYVEHVSDRNHEILVQIRFYARGRDLSTFTIYIHLSDTSDVRLSGTVMAVTWDADTDAPK